MVRNTNQDEGADASAAAPHRDDRRGHPRFEVVATALVLEAGGYAGSYLVMDLSRGGALLAGDARLTLGRRVSMLLRFPRAEPIAVAARIVRQEVRAEGPCFAVAFDASRATEERIERARAAPVGRGGTQASPAVGEPGAGDSTG